MSEHHAQSIYTMAITKPTGGEAFSQAMPEGFTGTEQTPEFLTQEALDIFNAKNEKVSRQTSDFPDVSLPPDKKSFFDKIAEYIESRAGNI